MFIQVGFEKPSVCTVTTLKNFLRINVYSVSVVVWRKGKISVLTFSLRFYTVWFTLTGFKVYKVRYVIES